MIRLSDRNMKLIGGVLRAAPVCQCCSSAEAVFMTIGEDGSPMTFPMCARCEADPAFSECRYADNREVCDADWEAVDVDAYAAERAELIFDADDYEYCAMPRHRASVGHPDWDME